MSIGFSTSKTDLVLNAIASVPSTQAFRVEDVLARFPELRNDRSALLDLAYEEFCQTVHEDDTLDRASFAAQFPEIETSLLELLEVHSFVMGTSRLSPQEPEIAWPQPGEVFLGFRLIEEIGRGAFARVFLAREVGLGHREVVVKISPQGETEAMKLGSLGHPHIVPIHSLITDTIAHLSVICMPYLGRTTANDWIQARFPEKSSRKHRPRRHFRSVIEIGRGVCEGLQFAHERKIFHCDVKPSNILITHSGDPVLLDFNLSWDPENEKHLVGGTLMYMAPEQLARAAGDRSQPIDARTDVFCLAASLYHMATGQPPFSVERPAEVRLQQLIEAALEERRAFFSRSHPLPPSLQSVLGDALALDPGQRISSAREFAERLARCPEGRVRSRTRWMWSLATLGAVGYGAMMVYGYNGYKGNAKQNDAPISPRQVSFQEPLFQNAHVDDLLRWGQRAEEERKFSVASRFYRQVSDHLEPGSKRRRDAQHAAAFCLLMDGQVEQSHRLLSKLPDDSSDSHLTTNRIAAALLLCLEDNKQFDRMLTRDVLPIVRHAEEIKSPTAEHHHATAVLFALIARSSQGDEGEFYMGRAFRHGRHAVSEGLSQAKFLAIESLLANPDGASIETISPAELNQQPDWKIRIPASSPITGKSYRLNATLE